VGGIFGLLVAIGLLYGDTQFLLFFLIGIKARYVMAIYALVTIAMLFGQQRMYAFAQLGGALAGLLWVRMAPRRGVTFLFSEQWYALRNRYYRWKVRGLHALTGPHRSLRRQWPPDGRGARRQETLELKRFCALCGRPRNVHLFVTLRSSFLPIV
jgi:hypothetical protein